MYNSRVGDESIYDPSTMVGGKKTRVRSSAKQQGGALMNDIGNLAVPFAILLAKPQIQRPERLRLPKRLLPKRLLHRVAKQPQVEAVDLNVPPSLVAAAVLKTFKNDSRKSQTRLILFYVRIRSIISGV